ncbi:ABC transporter permease subunit [Thalassobacillus hwangdonensis]|uniref:ABC transporter permease subunit n=1 Tax=Thalassobacillus hwangdonensis TaxID=546108 RepID=A0ABW3KYN9_9BACI
MKLLKFFIYYILGIIGILCISTAPFIFRGEGLVDFGLYYDETIHIFKDFINQDNWAYQFRGEALNPFTFLWEPYKYSMTILVGALLLGFGVAVALAFITVLLPKPLVAGIKRLLGLFEAIPDLMMAFLLQFVVVLIYKQTGTIIIPFSTLGDDKIYAAPIVVLAILPLISLFRVILLLVEEEMVKHYVEFGLSKGLKQKTLVVTHVFRNIIKSTFYHSKLIVWGALSSLFVVEYMFNINGVSNFILEDFRAMVIASVLIMFFTPFYILYQGVELVTESGAHQIEELKPSSYFSVGSRKHGSWKKTLRSSLAEIGAHFKNRKFLFGFMIIALMLVISFGHSIINDVEVVNHGLVYDDEGNLLSTVPHPPSEYVILGSDFIGDDVLDQILAGAKYTILFAGLIAFFRVLFGFLLAIPYALFVPQSIKRGIERFVDGFHFMPLSLIATILLSPVLWGTTRGFEYTFSERLIVEVAVLSILVIPLVTVLFGNEMKLLMKQDYIKSAVVLGGSASHLLRQHLIPHLRSKVGIVFGQQFIQVLLIFIHLGLFNLFLGGTSVLIDNGMYLSPPHSVTYEWSGLISSAREAFMTGHYWIVIPVFIAFITLTIAMQFVVEGIQEVQQKRVGLYVDDRSLLKKIFSRKKKQSQTPANEKSLAPESFSFVKEDQKYII